MRKCEELMKLRQSLDTPFKEPQLLVVLKITQTLQILIKNCQLKIETFGQLKIGKRINNLRQKHGNFWSIFGNEWFFIFKFSLY